jgi:hypothetical protein
MGGAAAPSPCDAWELEEVHRDIEKISKKIDI